MNERIDDHRPLHRALEALMTMVMDLGGWNNDGFFSYRLSREAHLELF